MTVGKTLTMCLAPHVGTPPYQHFQLISLRSLIRMKHGAHWTFPLLLPSVQTQPKCREPRDI